MAHVQRLLDRIGLLQIDSVNVVARAHLLPVFSRLGPYDISLLGRASLGTPARPRRLVEYWAHEASYIPPRTYRLLRWRMEAHREHGWAASRLRETPDAFVRVLDIVAEHGPVTASQVHSLLGHERSAKVNWGWNWTVAKVALEGCFAVGAIAAAHRTSQFERAYDLTERVLPAAVLAGPELGRTESVIELVEISARAHGLGTLRCLADYFRLRIEPTRAAVAHLVATGVLEEVLVRGWDRPVYLHTEAWVPRTVSGRALLAPFDPLVFERRRLEELFGMHYRIEIYTPAHKRVHGYYVLPFLLGDRLVARVDLKADRAAGGLLVRSAFAEEEAPVGTAEELAAELRVMAQWLGLSDVVVPAGARGDLVPALRALGTV